MSYRINDTISMVKKQIAYSEQRCDEYRRKMSILRKDINHEVRRQEMFIKQLEDLERRKSQQDALAKKQIL